VSGFEYSEAVEAGIAHKHPSPENGGPCHGCAFRKGTEANRDDVTQTMIRLCVEGMRTFDCHMTPGLCRGYIAAANLRGVPTTAKDKKRADVCGTAADLIAGMVGHVARLRG